MRNLTIINFTEEALRQYSSLSKRLIPTDYIFINNGLSSKTTENVRELFDDIKALGVNAHLSEYSHKQPTSDLFQSAFVSAINDLNVQFLTYADNDDRGYSLDAAIKILTEHKVAACGSKPTPKGTFQDYTGMPFIPGDEALKDSITLESRQIMPAWTLNSPWTLNLNFFRQASSNQLIFNIFSAGFKKSMVSGVDVDFSCLFAHLHAGFQKLLHPKAPLVFEQ